MKILGLDVGKTALKAAFADCSFGTIKRFELMAQPYASEMLSFDMQVVAEATDKLIANTGWEPERVISTVPNAAVTFRNLILPLTEKNAIHNAVTFEMEDELPLNLTDTVYDYAILTQLKKQSFVHAAATPRGMFTDFVRLWDQSAFSPNIITSGIWPIKEILTRLKIESNPVLVLDLGQIKTKFFLFYNRFPFLLKEFFFDGKALLHYALSGGMDGSSEGHAHFHESLKELTNEIHQLNMISKVNCKKHIMQILMTGYYAHFPEAEKKIESLVDIPTVSFLPLQKLCPSQSFSLEEELEFGMVGMLAACTQGLSKTRILNFRKREFKKNIQSHMIDWVFFFKTAQKVSLLAGVLLLSLSVQSFFLKKNVLQLDASLEKIARILLPKNSNASIKALLEDPVRLEKQIQKDIASRGLYAKLLEKNRPSLLKNLQKLSDVLPKNFVVHIMDMDIGFSKEHSFLETPESAKEQYVFMVANDDEIRALKRQIEKELPFLIADEAKDITLPQGEKFRQILFQGKDKEDLE